MSYISSANWQKIYYALAPYANTIQLLVDEATTIDSIDNATQDRQLTYGFTDTITSANTSLSSAKTSIATACKSLSNQMLSIIQDDDFIDPLIVSSPTTGLVGTVEALWENINGTDAPSAMFTQIAMDGRNASIYGDAVAPLTAFTVNTHPETTSGVTVPTGTPNPIGAVWTTPVDRGDQDTSNFGHGWLAMTMTCSGTQSPAEGITAVSSYNGQDSQFLPHGSATTTIVAECRQDAQSNGRTPGDELLEVFSVEGGNRWESDKEAFSAQSLLSAQQLGSNLLPTSIGRFNSWGTNGEPSSWTVQAGTTPAVPFTDGGYPGTPGTVDLHRDASVKFRGADTLKFTGNGNNVRITYKIPSPSVFTPNTVYLLYWYEYLGRATASDVTVDVFPAVDSTDPQTGALTYVKGTTTDGSDVTNLSTYPFNNATLPANIWRPRCKLLKTGSSISGDLFVTVHKTSQSIVSNISGIGITPLTYVAGLGLAYLPGDQDIVNGTRYSFAAKQTTYDGSALSGNATKVRGRFSQSIARDMRIMLPAIYQDINGDLANETYYEADLTTVPTVS